MWPEVFEPTQLGSFREKVHPPTTEPGDGPFVCVRFNAGWLPYVLGGLFQLVNPSSWLVDTPEELQSVLERATGLLGIFGSSGDCPPMDLRFTDGCVLQYSLDSGTTWLDVDGWITNFPVCNPPQTQVKFDADCLLTESFDGGETFEAVPGWAANFKDCVISNAPIIGLPPNPGDESKDQFACSIAAYLADQVILLAMQKAVNAIQDDLTLLVFGANVLTIIPEFILVAAAYDAFAAIYGAVAEGTLAHYEAAIADDVLWAAVTCAIYGAIRSAGYVTPGNFSTILANIDAISYTYSDVKTAIHNYISTLGATGLAQLSQRAGLLVGSVCDCEEPGVWCKQWGNAQTTMTVNWSIYPGANFGTYDATNNQFDSDAVPDIEYRCYFKLEGLSTSVRLTQIRCDTVGDPGPGDSQIRAWSGSTVFSGTLLINSTVTHQWDGDMTGIGSILFGLGNPGNVPFLVNQIRLRGIGVNPFGVNNCTS